MGGLNYTRNPALFLSSLFIQNISNVDIFIRKINVIFKEPPQVHGWHRWNGERHAAMGSVSQNTWGVLKFSPHLHNTHCNTDVSYQHGDQMYLNYKAK